MPRGKHKNNIYMECPRCKRWRYVRKFQTTLPTFTGLCQDCARRANGNAILQEPGAYLQRGYKLIKLVTDDFFYPMANKQGYVRENRLTMAKYLGRNLHSWEVVHHINGVKTDNRIENLKLCLADGHNTITAMQNRIDALIRENQRLKEEVAKLKK